MSCKAAVADTSDPTTHADKPGDKKNSAPSSDDDKCSAIYNHGEELVAEALISPPDGGWGWVIVAALFANLLILDGVELSAGQALLPILTEHFSSTPSAVSLVFSLQSSFYYFAGPFSGALVNAFGCRTVALAGALLCATGFFLSTFATSITYLYFTYGVLAGTGMGAIFLCGLSTVSQYFEAKRGLATAISLCGAGAGTFVMPPIVTLLTEYYHWRQVMLLIAGIQLHNLVFASLYRDLTPTKKQVLQVERKLSEILNAECSENSGMFGEGKVREQPEATKCISAASVTSLRVNKPGIPIEDGNMSPAIWRNMRRTASVRTAPLEKFTGRQMSLHADLERVRIHDEHQLRKLSYTSIVKFNRPMNRFDSLYEGTVPDSAEMRGSSPEMGSFLVSIIGIVNTVSRIIWGWVADRPNVDAVHMINCANLVAGTSTVVLPYLNAYPELIAYCFFFGTGIASLIAQRSLALVKFVGMKNLTTALGSLMMCMGFACLGGQPLAGYLYEINGFCLNTVHSREMSRKRPADVTVPSSQKNYKLRSETKVEESMLWRFRNMLKSKVAYALNFKASV
uniref:MFS domain-containing protein n=1 Tax=Trichuris muris TaxID=70415 RepID=A0A5S6R1M5_TRIMR